MSVCYTYPISHRWDGAGPPTHVMDSKGTTATPQASLQDTLDEYRQMMQDDWIDVWDTRPHPVPTDSSIPWEEQMTDVLYRKWGNSLDYDVNVLAFFRGKHHKQDDFLRLTPDDIPTDWDERTRMRVWYFIGRLYELTPEAMRKRMNIMMEDILAKSTDVTSTISSRSNTKPEAGPRVDSNNDTRNTITTPEDDDLGFGYGYAGDKEIAVRHEMQTIIEGWIKTWRRDMRTVELNIVPINAAYIINYMNHYGMGPHADRKSAEVRNDITAFVDGFFLKHPDTGVNEMKYTMVPTEWHPYTRMLFWYLIVEVFRRSTLVDRSPLLSPMINDILDREKEDGYVRFL